MIGAKLMASKRSECVAVTSLLSLQINCPMLHRDTFDSKSASHLQGVGITRRVKRAKQGKLWANLTVDQDGQRRPRRCRQR